MKKLEGITATGQQRLSATASNGDQVVFVLSFKAAIQEWSIGVEWENFVLRGNRVYLSPNILCQYEAIIPFGLGVVAEGGGEPFIIDDFSSSRVNLYLLSPEEVVQVQEFYVGLKDAG